MSHPITSSPLFPLPGEREEGEGSRGEGVFSCFGESRSDTIELFGSGAAIWQD